MTATEDDYKSVIFSGCSIDYKGVSICNLASTNPRITGGNEYQVWSDKDNHYAIYKNIDEAVKEFMKLLKGK